MMTQKVYQQINLVNFLDRYIYTLQVGSQVWQQNIVKEFTFVGIFSVNVALIIRWRLDLI